MEIESVTKFGMMIRRDFLRKFFLTRLKGGCPSRRCKDRDWSNWSGRAAIKQAASISSPFVTVLSLAEKKKHSRTGRRRFWIGLRCVVSWSAWPRPAGTFGLVSPSFIEVTGHHRDTEVTPKNWYPVGAILSAANNRSHLTLWPTFAPQMEKMAQAEFSQQLTDQV